MNSSKGKKEETKKTTQVKQDSKQEQVPQKEAPKKTLEGLNDPSRTSFKENIFVKKDIEIKEKKKLERVNDQKTIEIASKQVEEALKDKKNVPESVIKKMHTDAKHKVRKEQIAKIRQTKKVENRQEMIERVKKFENEYLESEKELLILRNESKLNNNLFVEPEPKIAFVIRIRGIIGISPKVKKILQLLRLRQIHNGSFVKLNGATIRMLRWVEPYIAYGYPNLETIKSLIYKRGFGKVHNQRIELTDNSIISQSLGSLGINSIEDLIHEIYTCGPHFKQANNFLWPFKLSSPNGGYEGKLIHFCEGGNAGNSGRFINDLIDKMI